MIHPSYVDLMKVVNKDVEEGEEPVMSHDQIKILTDEEKAEGKSHKGEKGSAASDEDSATGEAE